MATTTWKKKGFTPLKSKSKSGNKITFQRKKAVWKGKTSGKKVYKKSSKQWKSTRPHSNRYKAKPFMKMKLT